MTVQVPTLVIVTIPSDREHAPEAENITGVRPESVLATGVNVTPTRGTAGGEEMKLIVCDALETVTICVAVGAELKLVVPG